MGPKFQSSFAHLLNKPMSARQLMAALKSVGANFFPEEDATKYVSTTKKRRVVELGMYSNMALASCGYAFQWSRWNAEVSPGKVVVQVAEGGGEVSPENSEKVVQVAEGGGEGGGEGEGRGGGDNGEGEDGEENSDRIGDVDKVNYSICY